MCWPLLINVHNEISYVLLFPNVLLVTQRGPEQKALADVVTALVHGTQRQAFGHFKMWKN